MNLWPCCKPTLIRRVNRLHTHTAVHGVRHVRRATVVKAALIGFGVVCGACPLVLIPWPPATPPVPWTRSPGAEVPYGAGVPLTDATPIPEPGGLLVIGVGMLALAWRRR